MASTSKPTAKLYRCPTEDCLKEESAFKAPHYNPCPECLRPVGFLVEGKSAKAAAKVAKGA